MIRTVEFDEAMDRILERGMRQLFGLAQARSKLSGRSVADEVARALEEFPILADGFKEVGWVPPQDWPAGLVAADLSLRQKYLVEVT